MKPRFRAEWVVVSEELLILASCLLRPMIRNSWRSLVYEMSIRSLAYQQALLQRSAFFRVLPTRRRRKLTCIDTEPNFVTVTLCIITDVRCSVACLSLCLLVHIGGPYTTAILAWLQVTMHYMVVHIDAIWRIRWISLQRLRCRLMLLLLQQLVYHEGNVKNPQEECTKLHHSWVWGAGPSHCYPGFATVSWAVAKFFTQALEIYFNAQLSVYRIH